MNSEALIVAVEKHPCLWDYNNQFYYKKEKKDEAWAEILDEMIPDAESLDISEKIRESLALKKRWTHIRDYYKKDLDRLKKNPKGLVDRQYIYADMLAFLRPMLGKKGSEGYSSDEDVKAESSKDDPLEVKRNKRLSAYAQSHKSLRTSDRLSSSTKRFKKSLYQEDDTDDDEETYVEENVIDNLNEVVKYEKNTEDEKESKEKILQHEMNFSNLLTNIGSQTTQEEDDQRFLLSFRSDIGKLSEDDKIEFKIEMLKLLKKFKNKNKESSMFIM